MNFAIIAAGEGSRLISKGVATPKPLISLDREPMIDRLIRIFMKNDATSISIIVNRQMPAVYEHVSRLQVPVPLHIVCKNTPSSMHSFYELSPTLAHGRFCLTTVDTVFREDEFARYIRAFDACTGDGLLAVTDYIDDEQPLYVETDENNRISGFCDNPYAGSKYVSGGIYCLDNKSIPILQTAIDAGLSRMRNYQRLLVKSGLQLQAWPFYKIIDVDRPEDIRKAELFLKNTIKINQI